MHAAAIREARARDLEPLLAFWAASAARPSVTDTREDVGRLLALAPELVLVAEAAGRVVGTVVGGFDGWRGHVYRLAVDPAHRRRGLGRALVAEIVGRLAARGARRIHALAVGAAGDGFWAAVGWEATPDTVDRVRTLPPVTRP